jgi:hypothetical protein
MVTEGKLKMEENKDAFSETCGSIIDGVLNISIFALMMIFPLIYHNSYFDILETKYRFYYLTVVITLVLALILGVIMLFVDVHEFKGAHAKELFCGLHPANWKKTFRPADIAILAFWLSALISTLQSDYLYEAFWGNEGRYSGLFLLTLYMLFYFLISRCWRPKKWSLQLFLISGMVMCLIGITDYFQLDILRFRVHIKPEQSTIFTSTVGNINTYTAYVALIMGFSSVMFMVEQSRKMQIWYYICMVISFFAIIMGCSDNAYLALAALFGLSPFILFRTWKGIKKYLLILASFFTVIQCIDWINQACADRVIGLDSLFRVIAGYGGLLPLVVVLWILVIVSGCLKNEDTINSRIGRKIVIAWGIFVAVCVLAVIFVLYDANIAGHAERYSSMSNYLVFNDVWGTWRGYIWKASMRLYRNFPLIRKIFGYGPDTFGILTLNKIRNEMFKTTNLLFDNAHNEYLQYLITIGAAGLGTYLAFLISVFCRLYKRMKSCPYMAGILGAALCYCAQALVNLNLPIVAPVMWLLMSIAMTKKPLEDETIEL